MLKRSLDVTGMIIAGGAGVRLRPLTYTRPKPMMPIVGKPLLQYQSELLRRHGITDVVFCVGASVQEVKSHFGTGEDFGIKAAYSIEPTPLGTAGAIRYAEPEMRHDTVVATNGDNLIDHDLSEMVRFHTEVGADVTIGLMEVPSPTPCGVIDVDDASRVLSFREPDEKTKRELAAGGYEITGTATVNGGVYVISREALKTIPYGLECSVEKQFFPSLIENRWKVYGFGLRGYWLDVGTPASYLKAHRDILSAKVQAQIPGEKTGLGYWIAGGCRIDPSAKLSSGTYVGGGSEVGQGASLEGFTTVGPDCVIGEGSALDGCVLLEDVVVGKHCRLCNCIIDRGSHIGDGVRLGEDSIVGAGSSIF